jgi:adenylate cyclase
MNARLERKLRLLSGIVAAGVIAGIAFAAAMDRSLIVGIAYGLFISLVLGGIELYYSSWKVRCSFGSAVFRSRQI